MPSNDHPWDVATALRDLSADLAKHADAATTPSNNEIRDWLELVNMAAPAYWALETACEDLVEEGLSEARVQALKRALTFAQGQSEYWPRKHRW